MKETMSQKTINDELSRIKVEVIKFKDVSMSDDDCEDSEKTESIDSEFSYDS